MRRQVTSERLKKAVLDARRAGKPTKKVSQESGVEEARIYKIMRGESGIGKRTASALAEPLQVSAAWLLGVEIEAGQPSPPRLRPWEADVIDGFRGLRPALRNALLSLAAAAKKSRTHARLVISLGASLRDADARARARKGSQAKDRPGEAAGGAAREP